MAMVEVETLADLDDHLTRLGSWKGLVAQGLDLTLKDDLLHGLRGQDGEAWQHGRGGGHEDRRARQESRGSQALAQQDLAFHGGCLILFA